MITAKVQCQTKSPYGDQVNLSFAPNYADGANQEWAAATPSLSLSMTVKGAVGDLFEPGQKYTLQFVLDDAASESEPVD
jgi:hypothetical protein